MQLLEIATYTNNIEILETAHLMSLMEMHFSKKDLQDPNTVKKILNQKHIFTDIDMFLTFLIGIPLSIISVVTVVGPFVIIPVMINIAETLKAYPCKKNDANLEKLVAMCNKLIDRSIKLKETHPNDSPKYQEIIDKCNDTIKSVSDHQKQAKDEKFQKKVEEDIKIYNKLISFIEKPGSTVYYINDWRDIMSLAEQLKVEQDYLVKRMKTNGEYKYTWDQITGGDNEFPDEKFIGEAKKKVPEAKNNDKVCCLCGDDDIYIIYSPGANKVFEICWGGGDSISEVKIYDYAKDGMDFSGKSTIEADKRLGYYRLSKCPDAVIQKKLEV